MQKRNWIIGLAAVAAVAVALVLWWCTRADDYRNALPAQPKALLLLNPMRLAESLGIDAGRARELWDFDPLDMGVDLTRESFAFMTRKDHLGMLIPLTDGDKMCEWLTKASHDGLCDRLQERQGYQWTTLGMNWEVAVGRHAVLVMGPSLGADHVVRQEMMDCLRQSEVESGINSVLYGEAVLRDAPLVIASHLDLVPAQWLDALTFYLPEHANLSDINMVADLSWQTDCIRMNAEFHSEHEEINKALSALSLMGQPIEGDYADYVPDDALLWCCLNLDGETFLQQLRKHPMVRNLLLGLNMGVDADLMVKSIDGDMAITLNSLADPWNHDYLLLAHLDNKDFLAESDYWEQSSQGKHDFTVRRVGEDCFCIRYQDSPAFFGVKDETLFVAPVKPEALLHDTRKTQVLSRWSDQLEESRFFLWMNVGKLLDRQLQELLSQAGLHRLGKLLDKADEAVLYSTAPSRVTLELHAKDGRNSLKDLLPNGKD